MCVCVCVLKWLCVCAESVCGVCAESVLCVVVYCCVLVCNVVCLVCGVYGVCGVCGVCGSDDSGNGVSIQARSYLQLFQRQHKVLQEADSVRDLTCSARSLVSDKLVNQPLYEEKRKGGKPCSIVNIPVP